MQVESNVITPASLSIAAENEMSFSNQFLEYLAVYTHLLKIKSKVKHGLLGRAMCGVGRFFLRLCFFLS